MGIARADKVDLEGYGKEFGGDEVELEITSLHNIF